MLPDHHPPAAHPQIPRIRLTGPQTIPGAVLIGLVAALAWMRRSWLAGLLQSHPAVFPGTLAALLSAWLVLIASLWLEQAALGQAWRRRTEQRTRLAAVGAPSLASRFLRRLPNPFELVSRPLLRTAIGRGLAADWLDAGLGGGPWRYVLLLALAASGGFLVGVRIAGPLLSLALGATLPLLPLQAVHGQAMAARRRFGEQLPQALDALAAGLAAGLSFPQAVAYAEHELPEPVAPLFRALRRRMDLGYSVDDSLRSLLARQADPALALVVEGISLQRQFGGDLVAMLEETAGLLRERVELEREVQAVASQGRLSGAIVAALVPVSAGILLVSNPRYIDVLFETLIGQILLVAALLLQLAGWAIISRLVRVQY